MSQLIARLSTDAAVHELCRRDGTYVIRTYCADPQADHELTLREAGEWVDTVRRCGGEVYAPLGASLKIPPRQDAASERTS